jgi:5-methylcytosine-specific restriction endonuclease McrA
LFREANAEEIGVWFAKVVGRHDASIHGPRPTSHNPPSLPPSERASPRMPTVSTRRELLERDGYHCRFCEMPVVPKETIRAIACAYPQEAPWTDIASEQHKFFQAANLQYDHIVPHARGGTSGVDNMVITCAVCNYGRGSLTLAETGLLDPREVEPKRSTWDGLQSFRGL